MYVHLKNRNYPCGKNINNYEENYLNYMKLVVNIYVSVSANTILLRINIQILANRT